MIEKPNYYQRNIAITDLETTGLDPDIHEIIEIGLVLVKQPNLEVIDTLNIKIKPKNIETATEQALSVNGYNEKDWENALELEVGLKKYLDMAKESVFCSQVVTFDKPFIQRACKKTGLTYSLDYHNIDVPSIAWITQKHKGLDKLGLTNLAEHLGIEPEPQVHRAINGAMLAYKILKRIAEEQRELIPNN